MDRDEITTESAGFWAKLRFWFVLNCILMASCFAWVLWMANVEDKQVSINMPVVQPTIEDWFREIEQGDKYRVEYNAKEKRCELRAS